MIVLKFGGTSVQDASCMDNAISISEKLIDKGPVVVSSAMSKITDGIISMYTAAEVGRLDEAVKICEEMRARHLFTASEFLTGENLHEAQEGIKEMMDQCKALVRGIGLLKECSLRSKDALLSFGERLSTFLLYHRCLERGLSAEWLDARSLIKTDDTFNAAIPDMEKTESACRKLINPEKGKIIITQGFIGSNSDGVTTTLGRGGSDYSAAIIGAVLDAEEVQIWTDVNGIMTTDPRIVSSARSIPAMTYEEAGELAYFGAKVVHPATIQPAVKKAIPVYVKNTREADHPGTAIIAKTEDTGLKAISAKKDITVLNISSSRMLNAYGFLKKIFTVFDQFQTPVDLISTSEVSVSITIDDTTRLDEIISELNHVGETTVERGKSIVSLVGQELWKDSAFIARVFNRLAGIPIRMISLGSSDINLSFVVPGDKTALTIQELHNEFFPVQ